LLEVAPPKVDLRFGARRWPTPASQKDPYPVPDRPFFDLDQCSFLFMSAFKRGGLASVGEVMTTQIDNKGESLNANLWAEMSLMMALVVVLLAVFWQFL
jgi:hypothetical protein